MKTFDSAPPANAPRARAPWGSTTRVLIEPIGRTGRYAVRLAATLEVIVGSSRDPEHEAARALLARGVSGRLETWRIGASAPAMLLDVEQAAGRVTEENAARGPRPRAWTAYCHERGAAQTGIAPSDGVMGYA